MELIMITLASVRKTDWKWWVKTSEMTDGVVQGNSAEGLIWGSACTDRKVESDSRVNKELAPIELWLSWREREGRIHFDFQTTTILTWWIVIWWERKFRGNRFEKHSTWGSLGRYLLMANWQLDIWFGSPKKDLWCSSKSGGKTVRLTWDALWK